MLRHDTLSGWTKWPTSNWTSVVFWEGSDREPADDDDDDDDDDGDDDDDDYDDYDEFPLAVSLKEKVRVLRAGKTKLEKHLSTLQDLWQKAKLLAKPQWSAPQKLPFLWSPFG